MEDGMFDGYDDMFGRYDGRFDRLIRAAIWIIAILCGWSVWLILNWIFGPVSTGLLIFISFWTAIWPITPIVLKLLSMLWKLSHK
jgi:hypothetical protein